MWSFIVSITIVLLGGDSAVGLANFVGAEIFRIRPDQPWGPPGLVYIGYRVSFPGVKRPGRGVNHPRPSSAEVKERVEITLLPLWTFMVCSMANFTFYYRFETRMDLWCTSMVYIVVHSEFSESCKLIACGF